MTPAAARAPALHRALHHLHAARTFTTTRALPQQPDHYATLQVSPTATPADIKRSFYALSKHHHPDRNPQDRDAANTRFVAIGDAYAVLSNPEKRAQYDRERAPPSVTPSGSYSSSQYSPGGRPASGLSKRRSQFYGPPPSFYRSGGWGDARTAGKRAESAQTDGRMEWERLRREEEVRARGGRVADDGTGLGDNDVPHFNRARHFRTTTTIEEQLRQGRRKRRRVSVEEMMSDGGGSEVRAFFLISGIILFGASVPLFWLARG